MAILRDDLFTRGRAGRRSYAVSGLHYALVFVALALLVMSRLDHPLTRSLRLVLGDVAAPYMTKVHLAVKPMGIAWERVYLLLNGTDEVVALRAENARLREVEKIARQRIEKLAELAKAAKLVRGFKQENVISVPVLAAADGVFQRSLLIDGGRKSGIYDGYPVHGSGGLVGRTIDVTDDTARVLLLDDVNSRVPVHVGRAMQHAILVGQGGGEPLLTYAKAPQDMRQGDVVTTSGAGGVLPAGLAVGEVVLGGDGPRVRLFADSGPLRFVAVHRLAGPRDRLTGFLAAKAFERRVKKGDADPRQALRPAARSVLGPKAGDGAVVR